MAGKRQHFVPQFLLRNFHVAGSDRAIAVYRLSDRRHLPKTSVKDQAHENHFYGVGQVEDDFARMEGATGVLMDAAVRDGTLPDLRSSGHHLLVTFAVLQAYRTRAAAEATSEFAARFAEQVLRMHPDIAPHLNDIRIVAERSPLHALQPAAECLDLALDLAVKLLCNRTRLPFVLSDHPAVFYNQFLEPRKRVGSNTGITAKGLQLFLPIGPRHLLLFYDRDVYTVGGRRLTSRRVEVTSESDIEGMNLLQAVSAGDCLYHNGELRPGEIERLAGRAAKFRATEKASTIRYEPASGDFRNDGVLIRLFEPDVRTRLDLRCVRLTPEAERYDLGDRMIHRRNPLVCRLHDEYRRLASPAIGSRGGSASSYRRPPPRSVFRSAPGLLMGSDHRPTRPPPGPAGTSRRTTPRPAGRRSVGPRQRTPGGS